MKSPNEFWKYVKWYLIGESQILLYLMKLINRRSSDHNNPFIKI